MKHNKLKRKIAKIILLAMILFSLPSICYAETKMVAGGEAKEVKNEKVNEKKENDENSVGFENIANIVVIGQKGGEEQPAQAKSIEEDFVGFYKSFILELGGVKVTCYDNKGSEVFKYDVLPEQFRGSSLGLETKYIETEETIILSSKMSIDTSGSKFSDAIPQLTSEGNKKDRYSFIQFEDWTEYKDIESWAGSEENIKKLIEDIGEENNAKFVDNDGNNISFIDWLKVSDAETGTNPSLLFEATSYYPESTEQIYCNKLEVAEKNGMQWNSDFFKTISEDIANSAKTPTSYSERELKIMFLNNKGVVSSDITEQMTDEEIKKYINLENNKVEYEKYVKDNFEKKSDGYYSSISAKSFFGSIVDTITAIGDWLTKTVYYNIGIFKGYAKTKDEQWEGNSGNAQADISTYEKIQAPAMVNLTWNETETYSHAWETDGFFANHLPKLQASGLHADSGMAAKYPERYINGIGKASYIYTDHNKLCSVIVGSGDAATLKTQQMLQGKGLYSEIRDGEIYKYDGALVLCGVVATKSVTTDEEKKDNPEPGMFRFPEKTNQPILYEDELSFPFSLWNSSNGNYLKGTLKVGSGHHIIWKHEHLSHHTKGSGEDKDCYFTSSIKNHSCSNKKTSGDFWVGVHDITNFGSMPFVIDGGNGTNYSWSGILSEGGSHSFELSNHYYTGYRDETKDLRTAYPGKNSDETLNVLSKYGITEGITPHQTNQTEGQSSVKSTFKATIDISASGNTENCEKTVKCSGYKSGTSCDICGGVEDEGGEYDCPGGGESFDTAIGNGYIITDDGFGDGYDLNSGNRSNTRGEQAKYLSSKNSVEFIQKYLLGNKGTGDKVNPPESGAIDNNLAPFAYFGSTYGYYNKLGNTLNQISKKGNMMKYYPYVKMRYASVEDQQYKYAYILSQNASSIPESTVVNVAMRKPDNNEPTIYLNTRWNGWAETMQTLSNHGISDKQSVAVGGSIINLITNQNEEGSKTKNTDYCDIGIEAYKVCAADDNLDKMATYDKTESAAVQDFYDFEDNMKDVLSNYNIVKKYAEGIYKQSEEEKFEKDAKIVDNGRGSGEVNEISNGNGGKNKLDREHEKYYLHFNENEIGDERNDSRINVTVNSVIDKFELKADTDGYVYLYVNENLVQKFKGEEYNNGAVITNSDWKNLNFVNGFLDNYINATDFAKGKKSDTRWGEGTDKWYNEANDGLMVVRYTANVTLGFNTDRYETIDPNLCGYMENKNDIFSDTDVSNKNKDMTKEKWRTFKYETSDEPHGAYEGKAKGYIGTLNGIDIILPNMKNTLYSKLYYLGNATTYDVGE